MIESTVTINQQVLSGEHPPYLVAEVSANHGGSLQKAMDTIGAAKEAGADAVKIQTYTADTLTIDCDKPDFLINSGTWKGERLYELYQKAQTPYEWHEDLFKFAEKEGITLFSTPFDNSAIDLLETFNVPAYKIASFELLDYPLLESVCNTQKPIILSTGMASYEEIQEVNEYLKQHAKNSWLFLYCISGYPTPINQSNLHTLVDMRNQLQASIGLSDHSMGFDAAITATALGAVLIEKHFMLKRSMGGPDASFSMEPDEWREMVDRCHSCWSALGKVTYELKPSEKPQQQYRRSIYAVKTIEKGEVLSEDNIRCIRPGFGLPPRFYKKILGLKATQSIQFGEALSKGMIEPFQE